MDAVFVFSEKAARDQEGRTYIGTSFSQEIFDRYLEYFDYLTIIMRRDEKAFKDESYLAGMNLLTDPRIRIVFLPDTMDSVSHFANPYIRREIRRTLEDEIGFGKAVILRMHSYNSYVAARICVKRRIPYLAEAVGCPWDSLTHHSLKGKILAPIAVSQMRYSMRHAAFAVYVTRSFLQKRYPSKGKCISVSDVELLPPVEKTLDDRLERIKKWGKEPNQKLIIGTAGSVQVAYKGQRFVFKALADLKRRGICRFDYHLAGGGDNSVLRRLAKSLDIEDIVFFDGMMPHDQIYNWLDGLDVYIQPSEQEGLSRALIEAMSRALPSFASDVGGNPELLNPFCIHKCGDVEEIKKELTYLTSDKMLEMAEQNFNKARKYERNRLQIKRRRVLSAYEKMAALFFSEQNA